MNVLNRKQAHRLAVLLIANQVEARPPSWEDAPELDEESWRLVQEEVANHVDLCRLAAGGEGFALLKEAS